ncbi:hypothetical protein [Amycolatopsis sp. NPDC059021]|uniref:hypothetical protein n=1 Tax=Amycolatopsis sp. NPDC059021 TaxID=3346704 RepID=UPI00366EEEE0
MFAKRAAVVGAGIVTLLGGVLVGQASASSMVTTYQAVNIRETPSSGSRLQGRYPANYQVLGLCWTYGETISDNGVVNNIWVSTGKQYGIYSSFVSAVYLKGDARGNMPVSDRC